MPIYDYVCQNKECEEEFEVITFNLQEADQEIECPKCGSKAKKRPSAHARMKQNWSSWHPLNS